MGKNKGKPKVKKVFKVAGAKSLKIKARAKAVNTQLKKINNTTKEKIAESNIQLLHLEDAIRQTTSIVKKQNIVNIKKDVQTTQKKADELKRITDKSIEEIQSIKM